MATVVDQGYNEIMDMFSEIDDVAKERYLCEDTSDTVCLFNPTSSVFNGIYKSTDEKIAIVKDLEPYSFSTVRFEAPPKRLDETPQELIVPAESILTGNLEERVSEDGEVIRIENEFFEVEADNKGIRKITHKQDGVISETTDGIRPCEWILESDFGSPWARLAPPHSTLPLKNKTKFVCIERGEHFAKLCYKTRIGFPCTNIPGDSCIEWSIMLMNGYPRIKLDAKVCWVTADQRLMVSFPLSVDTSRDIYGIPGGWLERKPYEPNYSHNGADGDYPAFRYAGVESDNKSIAVFNRGTPAYKILPASQGKILHVSVLRSPTNPAYLHEPRCYTMTEYDGMRDEGMHSFDFELAVYGSAFSKSSVVRDAEQFSRPLLCVKEPMMDVELPVVKSGSASVTHIKIAEDGEGIVVRVTEHGGVDGVAEISVPSWVKNACVTDMPEKNAFPIEFGKTLKLRLRAFEIASLRLTK